jgi:hypothetical protein
MTEKEKILELMKRLPDDATIEDAIYELYTAYKIRHTRSREVWNKPAKGKVFPTKKLGGGSPNGGDNELRA